MSLLAYVLSFSSIAALVASPVTAQAHVRELYHLGEKVELENLAVRSGGQVLTTGVNRAVVYQFDPAADDAPTALVQIPDANSVFGIAEYAPDVFAVTAGNWTRGAPLVPGTFSVWTVDLGAAAPAPQKLADFPRAAFLNGMTAVPRAGGNSTLLITDTGAGTIYHLDPTTATVAPVLAPANGTNATATRELPQMGINGIRYNAASATLYFTNTLKRVFVKVPLAIEPAASGLPRITAAGPFTVVASDVMGDDFAVAADGTAYIGANPVNTVYRVTPAGAVSVVAGGPRESIVAGASSAAFGVTERTKHVVYVTTNGLPVLANGTATMTEGGKLIQITLAEDEKEEGDACED
ncbi:hypothetical protein B2J93_449 [Marssonina coronariae]|uniref:SMP-30/Gluconolactonase/LRE-like region domain-containing protein n=1 Tax=Diplocarpon coronariae TaxID=2795749 RepID=A0A218YTM9_9HELO|nr:hypothetical protein B2J93_449 [Marssonina coronariae]